MNKRVVITGMNLIAPLGKTIEEYRTSLHKGVSAVDYITLFDTIYSDVKVAAEVKDFDFREYLSSESWGDVKERKMQFYLATLKMLLEENNKVFDEPDRVGLSLGAGMALLESHSFKEHILPYIDKEQKKLNKERVSHFRIKPNVLSHDCLYSQFARYTAKLANLRGPAYINCSACAGSTKAIGLGYRLIKDGRADVMIAGGTDAAIENFGVYLFNSLGAISNSKRPPAEVSRPFDAMRDGFVLGEGAGLIILEELSHALKHKRKIYAEIVGWGNSSDAYNILLPDPEGQGAFLSMTRALKDADLSPEDIDYINAHGTSTIANDRVETKAIKDVFGKYAYQVPVCSYKSMFGHLLVASGVVELIGTILDLNDNLISPLINYENPDFECDLDYVRELRPKNLHIIMKNSFGFGGENSTLIIKKYVG